MDKIYIVQMSKCFWDESKGGYEKAYLKESIAIEEAEEYIKKFNEEENLKSVYGRWKCNYNIRAIDLSN